MLSSGRRSSVYFDKFRFLTNPALLGELAKAVGGLLPPGVSHVASPEGAAVLLLAAVSLEAGLPAAVVRKEPKAYGTAAQIEGGIEAGARVALIEDVATTGGQVLRAAHSLEEAGAEVVLIVLAIDRGGAAALRQAGYRVEAIASAPG